MKTKDMECSAMVGALELAEIFTVEVVDNSKQVNRWGFFADMGDGNYTIYKPVNPVCAVNMFFDSIMNEEEPGQISTMSHAELTAFLRGLDTINPIAGMSVSDKTPCGWYYDTII